MANVRRLTGWSLLAVLLPLWGCGGSKPASEVTAPAASKRQTSVDASQPDDTPPPIDESTVPAELVRWTDRALALRDTPPALDDEACEDIVDAAEAAARRGRPEYLGWRAALDQAYGRNDMACVIDLHQIGGLDRLSRSDFVDAIRHYEAARYVALRTGDVESWASSHLEIASSQYLLGRYEAALRDLEEVVPWLEAQDGTMADWRLAAALSVRGKIFSTLGRSDEAIETLRKSLDLRRDLAEARVESERASILVPGLIALGRAYLDAGRLAEAEPLLERAVNQSAETSAGLRATTRIELAELRAEQGRPDAARRLLGDAGKAIEQLGTYDVNIVLHFEYVRSRLAAAESRHAEAAASAETLFALLEAHRSYGGSEVLAPFFSRRRYYADHVVQQFLDAGRVDRAFEAAEWLRSRGLLDALLVPQTDVQLRAPREQVERADALRRQLLERSLGGADAGEIRALRDALRRLDASLRRQAGALVASPVDLEEVRRLLAPDDLLLCLWSLNDRTILWILDGPDGQLEFEELAKARQLDMAARRVVGAMAGGRARGRGFEREIASLSRSLLGPVQDALERPRNLLVVAEGGLSSVPYGALVAPDGGQILRRHTVVQVHSLSVLAAIRSRAVQRPEQAQSTVFSAVMAAGDGRTDDGRYRALAVSEDVAREVTRLIEARSAELGESGDQRAAARVLHGAQATRRQVLEGGVAGSRYVHFGAHVELHRSNPDLSAIYLFDPSADETSDRALWLRDLDRLQLAADVVTLAGCQSAGELQYDAEGPMAFPRGFLYAGADAVVASLWPVHDQPSSELMIEFYRLLVAEGLAPAEALRRAQLHLFDGDWPEAVHWAGWVILGDGSKI